MDDTMKNQIIDITIKQTAIRAIQQGYPLILKNFVMDLKALKKEGSIIRLVDRQSRYLATAYYGIQNKGIGWILSIDESELIDQAFFDRKITAAIKERDQLFADKMTTAFRIFNSEGDGIGGITIDYYDGYYMIQWYSEGIYQFRHFIYHTLTSSPGYQGVYEKKRFNRQGQYIEQDDFVQGKKAEFPLIMKENGMNYAVHLNDGAMTGIFLDQRNVRKLIRDKYAMNKTVLNTFSYTGAFSIAALYGGATRTVNIDLAQRSLEKTREQMKVNHFHSDNEEIRVMDVFNYFKYAKRKQLAFDLVILDPPSFARSKKFTFSTAKDYPELVANAIAITKQGGVIVASTNNASFGMKKFKEFIDAGFKQAKKRYQIMEEQHLPQDFKTNKNYPEFNYLKVVFVKVI